MKNLTRVFLGLTFTIVVFSLSMVIGSMIDLRIYFIPSSFIKHSLMLLFSIVGIMYFHKYVDYKISFPKIKTIIRPALTGLLVTIIFNIMFSVISSLLGAKTESHAILKKMSPLQVFLFVFVYASIAEEILFRGFLLNILAPLKVQKVEFFRSSVSVSVIISAFVFGLAHLILISTGAGVIFLIRIVAFTTLLGLVAGYYQEKYENNAYAIIVHMSGNLMAVIGSIIMSMSV